MINNKPKQLYLIGLILFIKCVEWLLVPLPGIDAFGTIGEIFTDQPFPSRNHFYNAGSLYISGYLAFPFFSLWSAELGIFVFYLLFSLLSLLFLMNISTQRRTAKAQMGLVYLAALLSPYLYTQRSEVIGLSICTLLVFLIQKEFNKKIKLPGLTAITIFSYFVHPVAFLCCTYLLFTHFKKTFQFKITFRIKIVLFSLIALFLMILWVYFSQSGVMPYYKGHLHNRFSDPSIFPLLKFFVYSSLLAAVLVGLLIQLNRTERLALLSFMVLLILLRRDFYFIYLLPVIAYHISNRNIEPISTKTRLYLYYPLIGLSVFITFFNPLFIKSENRAYQKVSESIPLSLSQRTIGISQHVHIDPVIASSFVFRSHTTQIIIGDGSDEFYPREKIKAGDIVYLKSPQQVRVLKSIHPIQHTTLIQPIPGLLTARSLYSERQDSLGLFECKILE